jgi:hypothetical protein
MHLIIFENSIPTSQKTRRICITKTNRLMLPREIVAVYHGNHKKHVNKPSGQNVEFLNTKQEVHIFTNNFKSLNGTGDIQPRVCSELHTCNTKSVTFPTCYIEANYLNTACEQHGCQGGADNDNALTSAFSKGV